MMLNKGRYGREQILSRTSVELMTSDRLMPEQRAGPSYFSVRIPAGASDGRWTFGGNHLSHPRPVRPGPAASAQRPTTPAEGMIGILFTQRMLELPEPPSFTHFWTLAYGAME